MCGGCSLEHQSPPSGDMDSGLMASLRDFDVTRYVPQTVKSSDFSSKVPRDTVALVVFIINVLFLS